MRKIWMMYAAFGLAMALAMPVQAQVKIKSGTEATYAARSSEAAAVKRWLIDQTLKGGDDTALGDFESLGEITVRYSKPYAGNAYATPYPPVPLPASGTPGSTIGISSCSGGISQEWVYMWVGGSNNSGSWVLQSYTFMRVRTCASGV